MTLEETGFTDLLVALRHLREDALTPSEGVILDMAIAEITRLRKLEADTPTREAGMLSELHD